MVGKPQVNIVLRGTEGLIAFLSTVLLNECYPYHWRKTKVPFRDFIAAPHKLAYIEDEERHKIPCIFCAIINSDPRVITKIVYQNDNFMVILNMFPFNPGHCMVVPLRHVERLDELSPEELNAFFEMGVKTIRLVEAAFNTTGVNMGLNIGSAAGASILHLHLHIVPRYPRELGFMETAGDTRTLVMDADTTFKRLKPHLALLEKEL
ncbi:MAG: HIT family protein [Promethearchaeota archaeon]